MRRALRITIIVFSIWLTAYADTETRIELCLPEVGSLIAHATASFRVEADFTVDSSGHPTSVTIRKSQQQGWPPIDRDRLADCIRHWHLGPAKDESRFVATWAWVHERGWDNLLIEGPGLKQRIVINGDHCFYCPGGATPSNRPVQPTRAVGPRG